MSRALFHDVRGVLGAAASNVEFVRSRGVPDDVAPVFDEIAHELRLVSDIVALIGAADDRVVEVDLRAVLFFTRDARPFAVDATHEPFAMRAERAVLLAFGNDLVVAGTREARIEVAAGVAVLGGLEAGALERLRSAASAADASVIATVQGASLILRRRERND